MKKKLFSSFFAVFFSILVLTLLVVQLSLTTPEARDIIAETSGGVVASNSTPTGVNLGELTLSIHDVQPHNNIKILQNGVVIGIFNQPTVIITVEDNALIEIDGSKIDKDFRVQIDSQSSNVKYFKDVREITVQKNIAILARIFIEE
ncbi:hypothetical protein FACS189425_07300 [Clostridia bacterium]|nr:hypothetical protein FACS189425_07300 [Clostridia bacterium]